jgi:pimeloyl-ACP methyl ester carboxylesterase
VEVRSVVPEAGPVVVFLHGFMTAPSAYRVLLEPVQRNGFRVETPSLYPRGVAALLGRHPVEDEAAAAAELVRTVSGSSPGVVLAGHSRGGQAAWRAADLLAEERLLAALILVDPVDGGGRAPQGPTATREPAGFDCPCLVVGAGLGGRCAPAPVNHDVFAAAAPQARHVVVRELGHADILDGRPRALGRRLCGGAADPDDGRDAVSRLLVAFALHHDVPADPRVDVVR